MDMDVRRAIGHGVIQRHVTFKPLMHVPRLRNVDGNPTAVLGLFGVNEIARQGLESSIDEINLVLILLTGLPGPIDEWGRRAFRLWAATEQIL
jgi:hypothetical protein